MSVRLRLAGAGARALWDDCAQNLPKEVTDSFAIPRRAIEEEREALGVELAAGSDPIAVMRTLQDRLGSIVTPLSRRDPSTIRAQADFGVFDDDPEWLIRRLVVEPELLSLLGACQVSLSLTIYRTS